MNHTQRAATLPPEIEWRTSSYSGGQGNCLEAAMNLPHSVPVRDTKHRGAGPVLHIPHRSWTAFLASLG